MRSELGEDNARKENVWRGLNGARADTLTIQYNTTYYMLQIEMCVLRHSVYIQWGIMNTNNNMLYNEVNMCIHKLDQQKLHTKPPTKELQSSAHEQCWNGRSIHGNDIKF